MPSAVPHTAPNTAPADDGHSLGIDRKHLIQARKRFLTINQKRLERTRNSLTARQQIVLDVLPLLFHVNHPVLPGYVSQQTPAGVSSYKPSTALLKIARQLSKSFRYQPITSRKRAIHALYLMGSIGTIGQSRSSDLDIWVCYDPALAASDILELQGKCERLSRWASQLALEVCFFPMNAERFKSGAATPLSTESSGSAQHFLLLDEFYRTAIHLGGRYPLWWFVPIEQEQNYETYCRELLDKRFLRAGDVIDLGSLSQIPLQEFVTAGIWQLYKGIQSPYKSVLKLLLLEVYASQYPHPHLLAQQFKSLVYADTRNIDQLDPYLLVYQTLETYLGQPLQRPLQQSEVQQSEVQQSEVQQPEVQQPEVQQPEGSVRKRLELVRRCFYFKVNKQLSRSADTTPPSWQRQLLQEQVHNWGWGRDRLQFLDQRKQWKALQVIAERQQLVSELLNSYRFLSDFARHNLHDNASSLSRLQAEIAVLGRKLYAAFERKAGKIEWINPGISPDLSEPYLTLKQNPEEKTSPSNKNTGQWRLHATPPSTTTDPRSTLKSSRSLAELIVWAYCNGILTQRSQAYAIPRDQPTFTLTDLNRALHDWLPLPLAAASHEAFQQNPYPLAVLILVNLTPTGSDRPISQKLELDPLNIGPQKINLIDDIHIGSYSSWNEVLIHSFDSPQPGAGTAQASGGQGLEAVISEYLQQSPPGAGKSLPKLVVHCRQSSQAALIQQRIESLFAQLAACYYSDTYIDSYTGAHPSRSRFVLQCGGRFTCWQYRRGQVQSQRAQNLQQLLALLGQPQSQYSPILFDRHTLSDHPLHTLCQLPAGSAIRIGFLPRGRKEKSADIYVLDERGSVFHASMPFHDAQSLLRPLHRFLRSTTNRLCLGDLSLGSSDLSNPGLNAPDRCSPGQGEHFGVFPVEFFELCKDSGSGYKAERRHITHELSNLRFFNLQVIADIDPLGGLQFSIYCDQQEFHGTDLGSKLYRRVASYILARRQKAERYPCYITDLDLSHCQSLIAGEHGLQTCHFLQIKNDLERRLNAALQEV